MKTIHIVTFFVLLAIVQLIVPAKMIWDQEQVLTSGKVYKFKTQPIDPTDPFRGKYIVLNYEINSFNTSHKEYTYDDKIYVYITENEEGFAEVHTISKELLSIDLDYIITKVISSYDGKVNFELPFNRFYMEESKAPKAERVYNEANRNDGLKDVYALVYIKESVAVLGDVIINGQSISEYVQL